MEIEVNQQFYREVAQKKYKFASNPIKLKNCISQVIKAVVFERKSIPPIFGMQYMDFSLVGTMDLSVLTKKAIKKKSR